MHTTTLDTLEPALPSDGGGGGASCARSRDPDPRWGGTDLALRAGMLRTLLLVLACVTVAAAPAWAKKHHAAAHRRAHATRRAKGPRPLVWVRKVPPPTRVAVVDPPPPAAAAMAPAGPVAAVSAVEVTHGPLGPQASDDEVPGSRMKR